MNPTKADIAISDVKDIEYKALTFGILRNSRLPNEFITYFIMVNCNDRHAELLTENSNILVSIWIKYLSIRSLILTNDVSIIKVTVMAINNIRNFLSPINLGCSTFNFCKYEMKTHSKT